MAVWRALPVGTGHYLPSRPIPRPAMVFKGLGVPERPTFGLEWVVWEGLCSGVCSNGRLIVLVEFRVLLKFSYYFLDFFEGYDEGLRRIVFRSFAGHIY